MKKYNDAMRAAHAAHRRRLEEELQLRPYIKQIIRQESQKPPKCVTAADGSLFCESTHDFRERTLKERARRLRDRSKN